VVAGSDDELNWVWPAQGPIVAAFDESRNKGLAIGGKPGDAVIAAADGKVVYSGSGLRGYGNLVIIKHNETYLTAYAQPDPAGARGPERAPRSEDRRDGLDRRRPGAAALRDAPPRQAHRPCAAAAQPLIPLPLAAADPGPAQALQGMS
jgi:hypothetical protein